MCSQVPEKRLCTIVLRPRVLEHSGLFHPTLLQLRISFECEFVLISLYHLCNSNDDQVKYSITLPCRMSDLQFLQVFLCLKDGEGAAGSGEDSYRHGNSQKLNPRATKIPRGALVTLILGKVQTTSSCSGL